MASGVEGDGVTDAHLLLGAALDPIFDPSTGNGRKKVTHCLREANHATHIVPLLMNQ